jgi:septin family protein
MRFNVLVVGEGKIGKSTFISSLLDKYSTADLVPVDSHSNGKQSGVRAVGNLELTADCQVHLFESVGFGDNVNNDDSVQCTRSSAFFSQLTRNGMKLVGTESPNRT